MEKNVLELLSMVESWMIGGKFWGATSRIARVVIDGKTYGSTIVENNFWACGANWW
jgi:hypothetical protein